LPCPPTPPPPLPPVLTGRVSCFTNLTVPCDGAGGTLVTFSAYDSSAEFVLSPEARCRSAPPPPAARPAPKGARLARGRRCGVAGVALPWGSGRSWLTTAFVSSCADSETARFPRPFRAPASSARPPPWRCYPALRRAAPLSDGRGGRLAHAGGGLVFERRTSRPCVWLSRSTGSTLSARARAPR